MTRYKIYRLLVALLILPTSTAAYYWLLPKNLKLDSYYWNNIWFLQFIRNLTSAALERLSISCKQTFYGSGNKIGDTLKINKPTRYRV